ncbi:MAG: phosphodiester glycosidase family protein [bacterium]
MIAPEKGLGDIPGVKVVGSEIICGQPRCVRVNLTIEREGREDKQVAIFLSMPGGEGYGLIPVAAGAATENPAARLSDILSGWTEQRRKDGDGGGVIGAVNGGFFIFIERLWCRASRFYPDHTRVGDAIGLLMTDGVIRFPPLYGRAAFLASSDGRYRIARADMTHVTIEFRDSKRARTALNPELINKPDAERVVCYTPAWKDKATPRCKGAIEAALIGGAVAATGRNGGLHVPVNGCVVSAPEQAWSGLSERDVRYVEKVTYVLNEKGRAELGDARQALEAGPALVENGVPNSIDTAFLVGQGFVQGAPPFPALNSVLTHYRQLAPRVCIGITGGADVTVALFEGRRPGESEGLILSEAARFMAAVGCDEAVNLDGGASAELILHGETLNTLLLGAMEKKWLDRGLDFLNKYVRSGTLPNAEDLGGAEERTIGTALMIVSRE